MWRYETSNGTFFIIEANGRCDVVFQGENLGNYPSAAQAAKDLARGYISFPPSGTTLSEMDLPERLEDWEHVPD